MPVSLFEALRGNIGSFLGGADVELVPGPAGEEVAGNTIIFTLGIEGESFTFQAIRPAMPFTRSEHDFCGELLTAFAAMYTGFKQEGYTAHFRTALLASIMDITVARYLRGDRRKAFWPIQQLVQLLKNLSYQRYEGAPATTGFIVHRTSQSELRQLFSSRGHSYMPLHPSQSITTGFFDNPITYRFIDGSNFFFVANVSMQVTGILRTTASLSCHDVERLSFREIFSLVRHAGAGAFAVTVNDSSEIEVMINPEKLLVRRKGLWCIFDPDIFRTFLAGSIDPAAADDLLWTVYALSKSRHGTVILILKGTVRQLEPLKKGSVGGDDPIGRLLIGRVKGRSLGALKRSGTLLRILSSDGITIFNAKGNLLETGFIIDTSHAREIVSGGGRTTAASAASMFGKVIKVSQDGPIELYLDGRIVYRFG